MYEQRFDRWARSSYVLGHIFNYMVPIVQSLGKLCSKLVKEDDEYLKLSDEDRQLPKVKSEVNERITI